MIREILSISLIFILLGLTGCIGEQQVAPVYTIITEEEGSNYTAVIAEVTIGDKFIIELIQNSASTGYMWQFTSPINESLLSYEYVRGITEPGVIGGPATDSWTFTVLAKGTTRINLAYYPAWGDKDNATRTLRVTVEST